MLMTHIPDSSMTKGRIPCEALPLKASRNMCVPQKAIRNSARKRESDPRYPSVVLTLRTESFLSDEYSCGENRLILLSFSLKR